MSIVHPAVEGGIRMMIEIALSNVSAVPSVVMADLRINGIKGGNLLYPTELAFC
jgi:hypothetical protein